MKLRIKGYQAFAPGMVNAEQCIAWANTDALPSGEIKFKGRLPMMVARRLSLGCRLAVEAALSLSELSVPDAIVFSSRHAELARGEKILDALSSDKAISPTDFMMSVHNAACATFSIAEHLEVPVTSVAAGGDSFHAGVIDALAMLADGKESVLLVDFDSSLPEKLGGAFSEKPADIPYAVALLLEKGDDWSVSYTAAETVEEPVIPSTLQWLRLYLRDGEDFVTQGGSSMICWRKV